MALNSMHENGLPQISNTPENQQYSIMNRFREVGNLINSTANSVRNRWTESSTVTKTCIIGSATAVIAPLAIIPALSVVGFTSAGVAAGTIAASMQTAATASGSIFALCQSAAATGIVATSTSVGASLAAGATAGGLTAVVCKTRYDNPNNN